MGDNVTAKCAGNFRSDDWTVGSSQTPLSGSASRPSPSEARKRILSEIEKLRGEVFVLDKKVDEICKVFAKGLVDSVKDSFGPIALNDPLTRHIAGYIAHVGRPVSVRKVVEEGGWVKDLEGVERVRKNYGLAKRMRIHMDEMARKGVIVARGKRKKRYDLSSWVAPYCEELKKQFVCASSDLPQP